MKYDELFDDPERNLTGEVFGRLTVMRPALTLAGLQWKCECTCGVVIRVPGKIMTTGIKKSCGCLKRETKNTLRHGQSGTKLYKRWKSMFYRCYNPDADCYKDYGGRGIKVSDEWKDFAIFHVDMGPTFDPLLKLDRIDNNGNYCKENCRWVTQKINCGNRRNSVRVMHGGKIYNVPDLAILLGVPESTIYGAYDRVPYVTGLVVR